MAENGVWSGRTAATGTGSQWTARNSRSWALLGHVEVAEVDE